MRIIRDRTVRRGLRTSSADVMLDLRDKLHVFTPGSNVLISIFAQHAADAPMDSSLVLMPSGNLTPVLCPGVSPGLWHLKFVPPANDPAVLAAGPIVTTNRS